MIPQQTFESYPVFGDNATKVAPDSAKYSAGFQQADVLPAEWMNWAWNKNTNGITDLNAGLDSVEKEIINVLTAGGQTPAQAINDQLITSINYLIGQAEARAKVTAFNTAHPVGEIYIQYPQQEEPNTLYNQGGITSTWTLQTQYDGAFFRASGGNAAAFIEEGDTLTKQAQATAKNGLNLNSKSDGTGNADKTDSQGSHSHNAAVASRGLDGGSNSVACIESWGSWTSGRIQSAGAHTHNIYLASTDAETRPENFTVKVWKRTA